jgi:hypothetical protein
VWNELRISPLNFKRDKSYKNILHYWWLKPSFVKNINIYYFKSYAVGIVIASSLGLFFPRKEDLKSVDDISNYFWRAYVSVPILFSLIRITLVTFVYKFETPVYCYMSG